MKTGRRRKKEESQESSKPTPAPRLERRAPAKPARPRTKGRKPSPPRSAIVLISILLALVSVICGGLLCGRSCFGPRATPSTYVPAIADGSWTTTVKLVAPQVTVRERFRSDCEADPNCTVVPGTCQMRERADRGAEQIVDDYDEYAYNIYYEEAEDKVYQAAGDSFVVTRLNESEDWWEGDRHYLSEEWLDQETCQYTEYTVWITDPEDEDYEVEVLLSECEVWDHVVVKERVAGEEEYCQTENAESMAVQDTRTRQGTGTAVEWPDALAPANGSLEQEFEGTVVFRADGARRTATVTDVDQYIRYLTVPYYLGLDEKGNVVDLTDRAP